jgi:hypothetical protein
MPVNDAKAVMRLATRAFLEDKERVDELLERLADGDNLRSLCSAYGLVYPTTMRYLAQHHGSEYEAAKLVRADTALEDMAVIEDKLEAAKLGFNEARELLKSKQWRAERLNSGRYGQKQQVDLNYTDKTRLHLEALRELAKRPRPSITIRKDEALPAPQSLGQPVHIGQPDVIDAVYVQVSPNT